MLVIPHLLTIAKRLETIDLCKDIKKL